MRIGLKKSAPCLLGLLLAAPVFTSGCKTHNTTINTQSRPDNQHDDYRQWEHDTNRPHQDLDRRTPDDQREYQEWQQSHSDRR